MSIPAQFTNNLDKFLAEREGLLGLAFRSRDNDQTATWLAANGFTPDGPKDLKRALELEEGEVLPAFRLLFLPPQETPGLRAFFCQHLTPDLIRRGPWLVHAIRAVSLKAVIAVVERPGDLAPAYARLFGAGAISGDGDSLRVDCGEGELLFVTHEGLQRLYPEIDTAATRRSMDCRDADRRASSSPMRPTIWTTKGVKFTTTALGMAVLPDQDQRHDRRVRRRRGLSRSTD